MVKILKEIWKMYKKSIISSVLVILVIVGLIYFSVIQGRFIWVYSQPVTGYFVLPEFSVFGIILSLLVLLLLFFWFSEKAGKGFKD